MVRSKIQKDLLKMFKNVKKMGVKSLKSTSTLYVVLALTLINLFVFINNQDNESLFLFLVISLLVYLKTTNMISVLLVPLILVNVLIYLRRLLMNGREGFAENANMKEFIRFVETIQDAPSKDDIEGKAFHTKFVEPVISIKDKKIYSLENAEHILSLYNRLSEISTNENDPDSEYIAKVVERFKDHSNETDSDDPGDDKQKPKINKAEDDKQKPKINKGKKKTKKSLINRRNEGYENYGQEAAVGGKDDEEYDDEEYDDEEYDDEEDDYEADDYEAEEE